MKLYVQGSGRPVVFLHQIGSSSEVWRHQTDLLSKDYQVILTDFYGHGNCEDVPENITIEKTAEVLNEKLEEIDVKNAVLIGHGLGGMIATELAFHKRDKVVRLVLIDMFPKRKSFKLIRQLDLEQLERNRTAVLQAHYKQLIRNQDLRDSIVKEALLTDEKAYFSYMKEMLENDYTQKLNSLHVPIHCFYSGVAGKDRADIKSMREKAGIKSIKEERLYHYQNSSHFLMLEQQDAFTRDLENIIKFEAQTDY